MSIFNGRAMTENNNQETKPIVFKKVPIANSAMNAKVQVDSDALTQLINQVNENAAMSQRKISTNYPYINE